MPSTEVPPTSSPGISTPSKKAFPHCLKGDISGLIPHLWHWGWSFSIGKKYLYRSLITLEKRKLGWEGLYTLGKKMSGLRTKPLVHSVVFHGDVAHLSTVYKLLCLEVVPFSEAFERPQSSYSSVLKIPGPNTNSLVLPPASRLQTLPLFPISNLVSSMAFIYLL